jgi:hypothetical protein
MDRLARVHGRQTAAHVATVARRWLADRTGNFRRLGDRPDFGEWADSVTEAIEDRRMRAPESAGPSATDPDPSGDRVHGGGGVETTRDRDPLRPRLNEGGS